MKNKSVIIPLMAILFVMTAVPAIVAIFINGNSMRQNSEKAVSESVFAKLQANQEYCDELLLQCINEALDFILEKQYVELSSVISYTELNSDYETVRLAQGMNTRLRNFADRSSIVHSAFFYIDNADYLVSTDQGIVKLENYEGIDWLHEIIRQRKTPSGIWLSRTMMTDSGEGKEVLSYVYRSNSLYTASKVSIVINVDEEKLSRMICSEEFFSGGEGYLMDGEGSVLTHSDKKYLRRQFPEILAKVKQGKEANGIIDGENTMIAYRKSSLYDWIYVNTFSTDVVFAGSTEIFRFSIVMTLFMIMTGVVFAVLLSFRLTRPVRILADKMKKLNFQEESTGNELVFLSNALEQLKEREQQIESSMEERKEILRRRAISELMEGENLSKDQKQVFEEYFHWQHYLVCLLTVDDAVKYQRETTHEERKIFRNMIFGYAKEHIPEEYVFDCVRYDVLTIGILVNIQSYDSESIIAGMTKALKAILTNYRKATGWTMTAGVSLVHNEHKGIKRCAEEARQAATCRLVEGKGKIYFAHRFESSKVPVVDCYQNQKRILNYLELGDVEKIREELKAIVQSVRDQGEMAADNVMMVFHQILGNALTYLNKHNYSIPIVLHENQKNAYAALAEMETVEEIACYLERVFAMIVDYQEQENKEAESDGYNLRILKYMRKNYRTDINFEEMAAEIGISYSYARKLIKDSTGKSLIEYLNLIRVEEAKKMLKESNASMNEIAEAVGYHNVQSIYRFFKKYEGISPSMWREGLTEKKEE